MRQALARYRKGHSQAAAVERIGSGAHKPWNP